MGGFDALAAPFFAASAVLLWSGVTKLRDPSGAIAAIASSGRSVAPAAVRAIGGVELLVGATALIVPAWPAAIAVAAIYLAFALFLGRLLIGDLAAETCGCAGSLDVPPSWLHVAMNLAAAGIALAVAIAGVGMSAGLPRTLFHHPAIGVVTALGAALIAWLASLAVVYVPTLFGSYRSEEPAVAA
jgi:hypothetical protein